MSKFVGQSKSHSSKAATLKTLGRVEATDYVFLFPPLLKSLQLISL